MDFDDWSLRIFDDFNTNLDGGVFRTLAQNTTPSGAFVPPGFIQSWLGHVITTPFYNVTVGVLVLWGAFIPMFGAVLLCRFCARHSRRCGRCTARAEAYFEKCFRPTSKLQCCSPRKKIPGSFKWSRDIVMMLTVLAFVLLVFFVLLHFPILGGSRLTVYLTGSNASVSLNATIDGTIFYTKQFLSEGLKSANSTTTIIVANLQKNILLIMGDFISSFLNQMFNDTGVSKTFTQVEVTLNDIVSLTKDMDTIHQTRAPLTKDIDKFRGSIKSMKPLLLNTFQELCDTGSFDFRQQCVRLQLDTRRLENNFSINDVDFDGSTAATTYLKSSKINLEGVLDSFFKSKRQLSDMTVKIKDEILGLMPMDIFTKALSSLWASLELEMERNVIQPIDKFRYANPIQTASVQINNLWVVFFSIAWSLLLIFAIAIVPLVLFTATWVIWRKRRKAHPVFQHNNPSLPAHSGDQSNVAVLLGTTYLFNTMTVFHGALGLLSAVSFLTGVFFFCLSGVASSETCRYVVRVDGVRIADPLVDVILRREWDRLVANANLSQVMIPVTLKPPQHVLRTLFGCSNDSVAILPALGMTGMLNFSSLPNLPQFASLINQGRSMIDKNLDKLNIDQLMPEKYITDMQQAVVFLTTFAKKKKFSVSIAALETPLFKLEDYKGFVERLGTFYDTYSPSNDRVKGSQNVVLKFKASVATFDVLEGRRANLSAAFRKMETFENLTTSFKELITETKQTMANFKNNTLLNFIIDGAYEMSMQPVAGQLIQAVETNFHQFETSTFMCYDLHLAFLHFTAGVCGHLRGNLNYATIHFFIVLIWFQIVYTVVFLLLYYLERLLL